MTEDTQESRQNISVLYVEDDAAVREQLARVLSGRGYCLTVAEDGEQGLSLFRGLNHDIVLTDIMMPRLNGLEMARAIRVISPETQIVCMTAFSDTNCLIEAIDIGVNQFVLKPVELRQLFTALDRCQEMVDLRRIQKAVAAENLRAKKYEAIGILAGGMAHDFNNLLQVILGYASLARSSAEPGSKTESLLAIVEQSSENARELSTHLLTFAKGGDAFMKPVHLEPLITECITEELRTAPEIKAVTNLQGGLPQVLLDEDQMRKLLAHLIMNAREAMPNGGTLEISTASVSLAKENKLRLPPGEYVYISISDTGTGIPADNMPRIFDPYFSTKQKGCQKGMGLGLALCYSITKHHKGHIYAESEPGAGTSIHIYLPTCSMDL